MMKAKWFGIAGALILVFSLVLSSVAFAGGACCATHSKHKKSTETAPQQEEESGQVSETK